MWRHTGLIISPQRGEALTKSPVFAWQKNQVIERDFKHPHDATHVEVPGKFLVLLQAFSPLHVKMPNGIF